MFAVILIPNFSLQAVLRTAPDLARRAVAVMIPASRDGRAAVFQCTPVACAAGVEPGLSAAQAMARCAGLDMRARSQVAEVSAREAVLAAAWTLSPRVEDTADGICTVDLRGHAEPERVGTLLDSRARAAITCLSGLGLTGRIGVGRTPRIARYAAAVGTRSVVGPVPSPGVNGARLHAGSGHSTGSGERDPAYNDECVEPSPVRVIAPTDADERDFLGALPIGHADPSEEQAAVLAGWGVRTLGGLTALPRAEAALRLGVDGAALWDRAAGREERVLRHAEPPRTFEAGFEFEDAVETLEPLLFLLRRFCDQLALQLAAAGFAGTELHLNLTLCEGVHARDFRLPSPTGDAGVFFRVLHTHLETLRTDTPIAALRFAVTPARPLHRQQGLFDSSLTDPHGFNETLARVGAVVGADRVGMPVLENTHRPDAVRLESVPDRVAWHPDPASAERCPGGPGLRRHRPARPARVETEDGRPVWVLSDGMAGPVVAAEGPWRGSGEWWSAEAWSRDEWDIEIAGGGLHRIFESGGRWFVDGEYD